MEIVGLGMFLLVLCGALVLGGVIVVLKLCRGLAAVPEVLWEASPWARRRERTQSRERLDALNRAERIRLHVIDEKFTHAASLPPERQAVFRDRFSALADEWFAAHPDAETLPHGFGDTLMRDFHGP